MERKDSNSELKNIQISMNMTITGKNPGYKIGAIMGYQYASQNIILNATIINCNISGEDEVGGFMGRQYTYNSTIQNSNIQKSIISGKEAIGGFISQQQTDLQTIMNSQLNSSVIIAEHDAAMIIDGQYRSSLIIQNVSVTFCNISASDSALILWNCNSAKIQVNHLTANNIFFTGENTGFLHGWIDPSSEYSETDVLLTQNYVNGVLTDIAGM
ncbi:Hypothetical_protein [Hexamita inflata]|uniref:Hypothetical_protein n=1 Tax=Hexamita inflata TaxID=28002 RepID=A0AA86PJI8_9EUKA|nr:Hypothetical protein HINF_LOCUS27921 [Hexamita inflata]